MFPLNPVKSLQGPMCCKRYLLYITGLSGKIASGVEIFSLSADERLHNEDSHKFWLVFAISSFDGYNTHWVFGKFTTQIRRLREGYVFSRVCHIVQRSGRGRGLCPKASCDSAPPPNPPGKDQTRTSVGVLVVRLPQKGFFVYAVFKHWLRHFSVTKRGLDLIWVETFHL